MYKKWLVLCASLFVLSACGLSNNEGGQGQANLLNSNTKKGLIENAGAFHQYQDYSADYLNRLLGNQKFALFFHADWCPICKDLKEKINNELSEGRLQNMIILEADYDQEEQLKEQYGIVYQTTIVLFDESGNIADKIIGGNVNDLKKFFEN